MSPTFRLHTLKSRKKLPSLYYSRYEQCHDHCYLLLVGIPSTSTTSRLPPAAKKKIAKFDVLYKIINNTKLTQMLHLTDLRDGFNVVDALDHGEERESEPALREILGCSVQFLAEKKNLESRDINTGGLINNFSKRSLSYR